MKHLRGSLVVLLFALAAFYNIERLDFGEDNVVNIASFVYVLVTVSVLFTIRFRRAARIPIYGLIAAFDCLYLLARFFLFGVHHFWHGTHVYLVISELTFLSLITWLAHNVASNMHDFEEAVANITLSGLSRPPKVLDESPKDVQDQMYLCRRYDRPLSVVVLECDPKSVEIMLNRSVQDVQRAMMSRYVACSMIRVLDSTLRRTDLMMQHHEPGRFVILCPETDSANLDALIHRIRNSAAERLGVSVSVGIASFPDGALTFDELLNKAESQLYEEAPAVEEPQKQTVAMERG